MSARILQEKGVAEPRIQKLQEYIATLEERREVAEERAAAAAAGDGGDGDATEEDGGGEEYGDDANAVAEQLQQMQDELATLEQQQTQREFLQVVSFALARLCALA